MSTYYDIKETIRINDIENHEETLDVFVNHLVALGTLMLQDNTSINRLQIAVDGEKREFSGNTISEEFHNIIRSTNEASSSVSAVLDYNYYDYGGFTINGGGSMQWVSGSSMFDLEEHMAKLNDEQRVGLFYSFYNKADCSETAGQLAAYGEKNGKLYNGTVEVKAITDLPDGVWYSHTTAVIYDEENVENINEVGAICQEMTKFSSSDELTVNDNEISFYLNNLELKNNDDLVEFAGLCQKLLKATNGECCGADELNLTDLVSDDGRIVNIKIDVDNGYEISIQSTDF